MLNTDEAKNYQNFYKNYKKYSICDNEEVNSTYLE